MRLTLPLIRLLDPVPVRDGITSCDPDHNESRPNKVIFIRDYYCDPQSEAHMRKQTSFAVAATMLVLAAAFWAKSSVFANSANVAWSSLFAAPAGSFLPVRNLEPVW